MSKQYIGTPTVVRFGLIAWIKSNNQRTDYGDDSEMNGTRNSLALKGWSQLFPIPMVEEPGTPGALTENQLREEMERRQAEWDRLKADAKSKDTTITKAALAAFEKLCCILTSSKILTSSELKLETPTISCNAGFRRGMLYVASQAQRLTGSRDVPSQDVCDMIPGTLMVYDTEVDRIIHQQQENELAEVGNKKMTGLEKLSTTRRLFDAGCNEKRLRDLYSSTTGQKAYGICQANLNWPALDIYRRYFLPEGDPTGNRIPWGGTPVPALIRINNRHEADRKRKELLPLTKDELAMLPVEEAEVDLWFREFSNKPTGNKDKMMARADIDVKKQRHPLSIAAAVYDSVAGNTEANLKPLVDHKEAFNGIFDLVKAKDGDYADKAVSAIIEHRALIGSILEVLALPDGEKQLTDAVNLIKNPPPVVLPPTPAADVVAPVPAAPIMEQSAEHQSNKKRQKQTV